LKQRHGVGEVAHRVGHPRQPGDRELVACPEMIEAGIPLGASGEFAGGSVSPDPLAASITQRVEIGAYASNSGSSRRRIVRPVSG